MIKYYDPEELSDKVKYIIRGTYLFGSDKVIIEHDTVMNGYSFGNQILQLFTDEEPIFLGSNYTCINGDLEIDADEEMEIVVEIRVLNNDGEEVFSCCDVEDLQQHLVAVEIVRVKDLEE